MVVSIHMIQSLKISYFYQFIVLFSYNICYKSRSRFRYIIIYFMEQKQEQYQKFNPVQIKPEWLNQIEFGRIKNYFYKTNPTEQAQFLKLKNNIGLGNIDDTLHHILPGEQISNIMINCRRRSRIEVKKTCKLLSNHIKNHPAIHDKVAQFISKDQYVSAIEYCWSSIFWFRRNLVLGPLTNLRNDDPGNDFDGVLFDQQSGNYKEIIENCKLQIQNGEWNQALEAFLKLTPTNNVVWSYNSNLVRPWYVDVTKISTWPGNAGFSYH